MLSIDALTVTVLMMEYSPSLIVINVLPGDIAVTVPFTTVATDGLLELQVIVRLAAVPTGKLYA